MTLLVINNLLTNAIKFTPKGGEIKICSKVEDTHVIIEIRDTVIGIPEQLMEELNNGKVHSQEGTGGEQGTGIIQLISKLRQ